MFFERECHEIWDGVIKKNPRLFVAVSLTSSGRCSAPSWSQGRPTAGAAQHSGSGSYSFNPVLSSNNALKAPLERQQEPHNIQAQVPIVLTLFYPLTRSKGSIGPTAGTTQHSGSGSYSFNPVLSAYNSLKAQLHLLYPYILRYYYSLCTYIYSGTHIYEFCSKDYFWVRSKQQFFSYA